MGDETSITLIVIVCLFSKLPALATTSKVYVIPPWASFGVHVNWPVVGFIVVPGGLFAKLNCTSLIVESVTVTVKDNVFSSSMFLLEIVLSLRSNNPSTVILPLEKSRVSLVPFCTCWVFPNAMIS